MILIHLESKRDFKEMIAIQTNKMKIKSIYKEIINEILSVSNHKYL